MQYAVKMHVFYALFTIARLEEPDNNAVYQALSKLRTIVDSSPELQEAKDEYNRLVCSLSRPSDLDGNVRSGLYRMLTGEPNIETADEVQISHFSPPKQSQSNRHKVSKEQNVCFIPSDNKFTPDSERPLNGQDKNTENGAVLSNFEPSNFKNKQTIILSQNSKKPKADSRSEYAGSAKFTIQVPRQTIESWKIQNAGNIPNSEKTLNASANFVSEQICLPAIVQTTSIIISQNKPHLAPETKTATNTNASKIPILKSGQVNTIPIPKTTLPKNEKTKAIENAGLTNNGKSSQNILKGSIDVKKAVPYKDTEKPDHKAIVGHFVGLCPNVEKQNHHLSDGKRSNMNNNANKNIQTVGKTKKSHVTMSVVPNSAVLTNDGSNRNTGPFLPPPAIYYLQPPTSTVTQTIQLPPQTINHTFIPRMQSLNKPTRKSSEININQLKKVFKDLICNIPRPKPIIIREKPNTVVVTQTVSQPAVTVTNTNLDSMISRQQIELTRIFSQIARLYDLIKKGLSFPRQSIKKPVKILRPVMTKPKTRIIKLKTQTISIPAPNPDHQKSCVCPIPDPKLHPNRTGCYDIFTNGCHCILCYPGHTETKYKTRTVVRVGKNGTQIKTDFKEAKSQASKKIFSSVLAQTDNFQPQKISVQDSYRYQTTLPPEYCDYTPPSTYSETGTQFYTNILSDDASNSKNSSNYANLGKQGGKSVLTFEKETVNIQNSHPGVIEEKPKIADISINYKTRTVVEKSECTATQDHLEENKNNNVSESVKITTDRSDQSTKECQPLDKTSILKAIGGSSVSLVGAHVSTLHKTRTVVHKNDCVNIENKDHISVSQNCKTEIINKTTFIECLPRSSPNIECSKTKSQSTEGTQTIKPPDTQSCYTTFENGTTHIFCIPETMIPTSSECLPYKMTNIKSLNSFPAENLDFESKLLCSKILKDGCSKFEENLDDESNKDEFSSEENNQDSTFQDIPKSVTFNDTQSETTDNSDGRVAVVFLDRQGSPNLRDRSIIHDTKNNLLIDENVIVHLDSLADIFSSYDNKENTYRSIDSKNYTPRSPTTPSKYFSHIIHKSETLLSSIVDKDQTFSSVPTISASKSSSSLADISEDNGFTSEANSITNDHTNLRQKSETPTNRSTVLPKESHPTSECSLEDDRIFDYSHRPDADKFTCTDTNCYNYNKNLFSSVADTESNLSSSLKVVESKNTEVSVGDKSILSNGGKTTTCNSVGCFEIEVLTHTLPYPTITNTSVSGSTNTACDITKIITLDEIDYENGNTIIETITDLDLDDLFDKIETEITTSYYIEGGDDIEVINKNIGERIFSPSVKKGALVKTGDNEFKYIERTDSAGIDNTQKKDKLYISDLPIFHDKKHPIIRGKDLTSKYIVNEISNNNQESKDSGKGNSQLVKNTNPFNDPSNDISRSKSQTLITDSFTRQCGKKKLTDGTGNPIYRNQQSTFEECGKNDEENEDEYVLLSDIFSDRYRAT